MLNFLGLSKIKESNKKSKIIDRNIKLSIDKFEERLLSLSKNNSEEIDKVKLRKLIIFMLRKYQYENITSFLNGNEFYPPEILRKVNDIYTFNGSEEIFGISSPIKIETIETHEVFLDKDIILTYPWNEQRLKNCLEYHKTFKYFKTNHKVIYLEGLGVYTVFGGNHSIANGIINGSGIIECSHKVDIFSVFYITKNRTNNELYRILEVCNRNNIRLDRIK